jgi:hypothetical protein
MSAAQTAAERLSSRGLGAVKLPVSGEEVLFHVPHTRALVQAGLFPLAVSHIDLSTVDPDEREHLLDEADKNGVKLVCACCYDPIMTERTTRRPGRNECPVDSLVPEDYIALHSAIMELINKAYAKDDRPEPGPHEEDNRKALALACKMFRVDPTEVDEWPPERAQRLIEYAVLAAGEKK